MITSTAQEISLTEPKVAWIHKASYMGKSGIRI